MKEIYAGRQNLTIAGINLPPISMENHANFKKEGGGTEQDAAVPRGTLNHT